MKMLLNRKANIIAILIILIVTLMSACLICDAEEVVNYTTSKFNVQVFASNDNYVTYKESIVLNFNDTQTSFIRQLPENAIGRVSSVNVDGYDFTFDEASNTITIDLSSNPNPGRKSFSIKYTVNGTDSVEGQGDSLIIELIPKTWPTAIDNIGVKFTYDANMKWDSIQYVVDSSIDKKTPYGEWDEDTEQCIVTFNGTDIPAGAGVYISASFPQNYWNFCSNISWCYRTASILFVLGIIVFIFMRLIFGKETEVVSETCKTAPLKYFPIHIGFLTDGIINDVDISATLIEMARRGYISVNEYEKGKFEFTYIKFPSKEGKEIKSLFNGLFEGCSEYQTVKLDEISVQFAKAAAKASKITSRQLSGGRFGFTSASNIANTILIAVYSVIVFSLPFLNELCLTNDRVMLIERAILSIGITFFLIVLVNNLCRFYRMRESRKGDGNALRFKLYSGLYIICSIAYSILFSFSLGKPLGYPGIIFLSLSFLIIAPVMLFGMKGRSKQTTAILAKINGLKDWIIGADKQDIREMSLNNNEYFYELFPYSIIFGITKKLIRDFEYVDVKVPSWYVQYGVTENQLLDPVIVNAIVNNFEAAIAHALKQQN